MVDIVDIADKVRLLEADRVRDLVEHQDSRGRVVIASTMGKSMETGGVGDLVRVENLQSGRLLTGTLQEGGVVEIVADEAKGRVPILAGAAEPNVDLVLEACRRYADLGDQNGVQMLSGLLYDLHHVAVHVVGVNAVDSDRYGLAGSPPVDVVECFDDVGACAQLVTGSNRVFKVHYDGITAEYAPLFQGSRI